MAYVSPQMEGRVKNQNSWTCQNCAFNENSVDLGQCQYCGFLRAAFDNGMPQPIIQSNVPDIPAQPYPPQQFTDDYTQNVITPQAQQPTITHSVTVNVNTNNNNQQKENYDRVVNEQYVPVYDEDDNNEPISCVCAAIRLFLWLVICGGLVTCIWWFVCGMIFFFWFKPCFTISQYLLCGLCSKDNDIKIKTECKCYDSHGSNEKNCCCDICFTFMWILIFGIP
eukprot:UN03013